MVCHRVIYTLLYSDGPLLKYIKSSRIEILEQGIVRRWIFEAVFVLNVKMLFIIYSSDSSDSSSSSSSDDSSSSDSSDEDETEEGSATDNSPDSSKRRAADMGASDR